MSLMRRSRFLLLLTLGLVALLLLLSVTDRIVEWLWMQALGYSAVFWKLLLVKTGLFAVGLVAAVGFFAANFFVVRRELMATPLRSGSALLHLPGGGSLLLTRRLLGGVAAAASVFFGLFFALSFSAQWDAWLRFAGSTPYGVADPVFGHDVSFYLLRLPFVETLQGSLAGLALLGLLLSALAYFVLGRITLAQGRLAMSKTVVQHLAAGAALLLAAWTWGYYLDRYALLFEPGGVVFGAGYTDVHIVIPALWTVMGAAVALILWIGVNLRAVRTRLMVAGGVLFVIVLVVGLFVAPALIQQVSVEPNELQLETPYLEYNITLTRASYQLDEVEERSYPVEQTLTLEQIAANQPTIDNIRLWDPRLLILTYRQLQEIRTYYQFYNVDVDRYQMADGYRQVMLSARELDQRLPDRADTWVNRHLQYTHGYGLAMNLVAQEGEEGTPTLLVKDLPPVAEAGLTVTQPAIYYGERVPDYRIVNSKVEELDYPRGDENVYTRYQGKGGVPIRSFWRELLFAWYFADFNLLLSDYITPQSRIQFWNRVQERIRRVAPFLQLDADPYLVLSEGRLVWVQDAYTVARTFPYAEPVRGGVNYLRDAVKVVVDAYDGTVDFYVMDAADPVLRAYQAAFPGLFKPLDALSADLRSHLRYPQDLFKVQLEKLSRYHMTIPQVFYNNEDLWTQPQEKYGGVETTMEPYYLLMRLPGEDRLQFLLMTPLTPANRDNMIAWVAAKCDFPDYGDLVLYQLPKEKLIYGPNQVESRIDQDTEVSQQLSLWDQRGSRVIRGNLIAVPIAESFLYVEPVFLIAEGTEIPQLQRVIVSYGERVAMQPTLQAALAEVFGVRMAPLPAVGAAVAAEGGTPAELRQARAVFNRLQQAFERGDFAAFGAELEALRRVLAEPPPDTTRGR